MFAVHQKREMQRKDVEKKRHLMEKAGLVVQEVIRGDAIDREHERHADRRARKDRKRKKHHKHRHTRDRSSSVSSRSSTSSRERRHRKKHKKHRHHSRRHERRRDRSTSRDRSVDRHSDDEKERDSKRKERYHDRYDREDDNYGRHHSERKRGRSGSRDRDDKRYEAVREEKPRHHRDHQANNNDNGSLDEFGRKIHQSSDERRGLGSHRKRDEHDERKHSQSHHENKEVHPPKKEGYGLIGTSLSGNGHDNSSNSADRKHASLGPDSDLIAAKRREVERERQSKLDQSRRRWDRDGISRDQALEEFERNARYGR